MHLPKLQINDAAAAAGATFLMPTLSISFAISAAALRWTRPTMPPLKQYSRLRVYQISLEIQVCFWNHFYDIMKGITVFIISPYKLILLINSGIKITNWTRLSFIKWFNFMYLRIKKWASYWAKTYKKSQY